MGSHIVFLFGEAAKAVHSSLTKANLSRYSAHLLQVWACVLLDKAGMSPKFIKSLLQIMGNSFQMYLHDTGVIRDKHHDVLQTACDEVIDLISKGLDQHTTIPEDMTIVNLESMHKMGAHSNDMDWLLLLHNWQLVYLLCYKL